MVFEELTRIMHCLLAIAILAASCAGCAITGNVGMPQPTTSKYFITKGGSFALQLDDQRNIRSSHYSLILKPQPTNMAPLYLRTLFENPANASSPFILDTNIQPKSGDILLDSPDARGFQSQHNYKVEVLIFDTSDRSHQVGQYIQYIRYFQPDFVR